MDLGLRLVDRTLEHLEAIAALIKAHFIHNVVDEQKSAPAWLEQPAGLGRIRHVLQVETGAFIGDDESHVALTMPSRSIRSFK